MRRSAASLKLPRPFSREKLSHQGAAELEAPVRVRAQPAQEQVKGRLLGILAIKVKRVPLLNECPWGLVLVPAAVGSLLRARRGMAVPISSRDADL
ncbi:hypothetical protein D3C85_1287240 [compost metagenome]